MRIAVFESNDTRLNIFNDKSKGNRFNISIFVAYKKLLLFNNPII